MYARASARTARQANEIALRQNEIAIHNERLKIFKAFLDFRGKLRTQGASVSERDLWMDFWPHAQLAEFYYSSETSAELNKFIALLKDEFFAFRELAENDSSYNQQTHAKYNECMNLAGQIEEEMRKELKLVSQ